MTTVWHMGVPWLDRALESAQRRGVADAVSSAATARRDGKACVTVPAQDGAIRVWVAGTAVAAILGQPSGVVLGYTVKPIDDAPTEASSRPDAGTKAPTRARGRKASLRGPKDQDELTAWLAEDGYTVALTGKHYSVTDPEGRRVSTISSTASDHRSFINAVATIRRATSLPLRRESK